MGGVQSVTKAHSDPLFEGLEKTSLIRRDKQLSSCLARGWGAVRWMGHGAGRGGKRLGTMALSQALTVVVAPPVYSLDEM